MQHLGPAQLTWGASFSLQGLLYLETDPHPFLSMPTHSTPGGGPMCDVQPPSHTLFFVTGMDRIIALTLGSQLCPWELEED